MTRHTSWGCIASVGVSVGQVSTTHTNLLHAVAAHSRMLHQIFHCDRRRPAESDRSMRHIEMRHGSIPRMMLVKVVFCDEMGLHIPVWRIFQAYIEAGCLDEYRRWYPHKARRTYVHQDRNGPVGGTGHWGARHYRRDRTAQECRNLAGVEVDEDLVEYPGLVRAKRSRRALPYVWDEIRHGRRGNGWKQHRKFQYRGA